METIYTIPVNRTFEESGECPFCRLYRELEANELDLILGASLMEPDVRIKTNKLGFCRKHYADMFAGKNRLGLALMLETHLDAVQDAISPGAIGFKDRSERIAKAAAEINGSCYICERIAVHFGKMFETCMILWENDKEFRKKFASQSYFCLPHYQTMMETAKKYIPKKLMNEFLVSAENIQTEYQNKLREDLALFARKFDYRYKDEPWGDAKDSIERTIAFLGGK
jgi:hypothetical protein